MTERSIDLVPDLVLGQKRNGKAMYDPLAKAELVRRCRQPGVSVAGMALAHGINANLVRKWIRQAEQSPDNRRESTVLLPVRITRPQPPAPQTTTSVTEGAIELVLPGGTIRIRGSVEPAALSMAIDCLARRA